MDLYRRAKALRRCFVTAVTTKHFNFSAVPPDRVFLNTVDVFTSDRWSDYAVVQSTIHEVWARKYSGALKKDLRYSPTDCFATFPFPRDPASESALDAIGEAYHEHRRELMRDLWLGLTDLYNLFHRPDLAPEHIAKVATESRIPADEGFSRLQRLRALHAQLDQTVLAAYGWDRPGDFGPALELRHDFYPLDFLPENDRTRLTLHPESRREVLARLLKLNHQRAAAESAQQTAAVTTPRKKPKGMQPAVLASTNELPLFPIAQTPAVAAAPAPTLALPSIPREPLEETASYAVTVMVELLLRGGGSLPWRLLRAATDLLSDRSKLARLAAPSFGQTARDWLALKGDVFDATHRWDQLSGLCYAGRTRVVRRDGELVVELVTTRSHVELRHVQFDAHLALSVARSLPVELPTPQMVQDEARVAELIAA
jgi:hypothetical protein